MAVLRIHKKQQNFVILDKTCLNDGALSWGAKGLHAYLISLPDDWRVRVSDLKERARNGRDAVRGLLCELEHAGYIQKTSSRNDANGRFGGIEYIVLEVPGFKSPEPENTSSVKNEQKEQSSPGPENPSPETPATGNPAPVNTTLISINRTSNKKLSNKTAAGNIDVLSNTVRTTTQQEAAAVIFSHTGKRHQVLRFTEKEPRHNPIDLLAQEDALIGLQLTQSQHQRVISMLKRLNVSKHESLVGEVEFCLLNSKHFTACGNDFSRKLNAIRRVILRGDWQTPAGMAQESNAVLKLNHSEAGRLEEELREAQAEAVHFKKLLSTAKEHTRAHFEEVIHQAQRKIHELEGRMANVLSQQQEATR